MTIPSRKRQSPRRGDGRLVDRCVGRILDHIRAGRFKAGQRLGEGPIARELRVSKAPVKEALNHLSHLGVVERRPRSGSYVPDWSLDDYIHVVEVRTALEVLACRLACGRITAGQLECLAELAEKLDGHIDIADVHVGTMEIDFHGTIADASGNPRLARMLADHRLILDCVRGSVLGELTRFPTDPAVPDHRAIVAALEAGDPDCAGAAMHNHIHCRVGQAKLAMHATDKKSKA